MKQKILIYGLILTLLIGFNVGAQQAPTSLVVNYDLTMLDKDLKPGDSGTLIIVIQNTGGLPAKEVKATLSHPPPGFSAFISSNLGTINPGASVTVKTRVTVSEEVKAGTYMLSMTLDYKSERYDSTGKLKTEDADSDWQIPVRVYGEANFQISAADKDFYEDVTDDLVLKGSVKQGVRNVYAEISGNCASVIGAEKIYLGNLDRNENFVLNYTIKPNTPGICSMSVNFDYDDTSGSSSSETESFGLDIKRSNVDVKVMDVKYPLLNPGDTADIIFTLENVGSAEASDVTIILGLSMEDISKIPQGLLAQMAAEYPFVVVGSSEKYIKNFRGGETKEATFSVRINKDAKTKAYEIPLKIKYYDSAGMEHEISKTVGVEVRGKPEIVIRINEAEITKNKNIGKINVEIVNKGSSDAQFFNIKILPTEQYFIISDDEEYIGTLESDDSENVDFEIKVYDTLSVNAVPISLSAAYKDNYNNEYAENFNVNLKILSDDDAGVGGGMPLNIIAVLIVLVLIYLIYRKIR